MYVCRYDDLISCWWSRHVQYRHNDTAMLHHVMTLCNFDIWDQTWLCPDYLDGPAAEGFSHGYACPCVKEQTFLLHENLWLSSSVCMQWHTDLVCMKAGCAVTQSCTAAEILKI